MALIAHDRQDWKATSADADAAFNAPYLSAWEDLFDALVAAGDAGLATRTPESLALARDRIARAENLWRKNSRLPTKAAAGMLYNSACVGVLRGESHTFIAPRLLEAFMLYPSLIQDAHGDEDLKPLRLLAQPYPKESTVDLLHSNRYVDAPTTEDLIRTGKLSEEELV